MKAWCVWYVDGGTGTALRVMHLPYAGYQVGLFPRRRQPQLTQSGPELLARAAPKVIKVHWRSRSGRGGPCHKPLNELLLLPLVPQASGTEQVLELTAPQMSARHHKTLPCLASSPPRWRVPGWEWTRHKVRPGCDCRPNCLTALLNEFFEITSRVGGIRT